MFWRKNKKNIIFIFYKNKNLCILDGHVVSCDGNLTPDKKSKHGTYKPGDAVGCFL